MLALCLVVRHRLRTAAAARPANTPRPLLSYIGQSQVPFGAVFDGAVVGGLSGISYDPNRQLYYVISDDRSKIGPARFFTVQLSLSDKGISEIAFTGARSAAGPVRSAVWAAEPGQHTAGGAPRPGGHRLRRRPATARIGSSEGERLTDRARGRWYCSDPWVRIAGLDGGYLGQFTLPPNLAMSAEHTGPRRNRTLEGAGADARRAVTFRRDGGPGLQRRTRH